MWWNNVGVVFRYTAIPLWVNCCFGIRAAGNQLSHSEYTTPAIVMMVMITDIIMSIAMMMTNIKVVFDEYSISSLLVLLLWLILSYYCHCYYQYYHYDYDYCHTSLLLVLLVWLWFWLLLHHCYCCLYTGPQAWPMSWLPATLVFGHSETFVGKGLQ